jgi:multiple sugar transport system permease protein
MTTVALDAAPPNTAVRRARRPPGRAWPYLVPLLATLTIWVYGPLAFAVVLSFMHWDLITTPHFVGLANYRALLADPHFTNAAFRTVLYVAGMLPLALVLPLLVAIALWRRPGRAAAFYRGLLFTPMILAPVATAISWQFVLNPLQGIVHGLLGSSTPNWLGDPHTALWTIDVITSGKLIALNFLLLTAALSTVDGSVIEAARIDGATEGQITRLIVLPQLARTLVLLGLLCVVYTGQWSFTNIAVLTQGNPLGSTDNVYYRLYTYGFTEFDIGRASAGATLVVLVLAALLGLGRVLRRA